MSLRKAARTLDKGLGQPMGFWRYLEGHWDPNVYWSWYSTPENTIDMVTRLRTCKCKGACRWLLMTAEWPRMAASLSLQRHSIANKHAGEFERCAGHLHALAKEMSRLRKFHKMHQNEHRTHWPHVPRIS